MVTEINQNEPEDFKIHIFGDDSDYGSDQIENPEADEGPLTAEFVDDGGDKQDQNSTDERDREQETVRQTFPVAAQIIFVIHGFFECFG